ncbi:pentapeptide repeat-containing protein [Rhodococcus sp. As11]|uniref:pentapeptide repeat-containing protein n=1 Tax=Rhodococcus sp. As11 TaxID=3029189 RepID=UPI003B79C0DC
MVGYGVGALASTALATYGLAELGTPPGTGVMTADLSNLGRTVGLIAAAAVGVPAAVLAYHRQRALDTANSTAAEQHEHKVQTDDREHRTGTERHLRERYTTCAEQLGHDNFAIRLAGVYALASLADDWHEFGNDSERQVCIDLLCAYLRTQRQLPQSDLISPEEQDRYRKEERQVRAAVVSVIRDRTMRGRWEDCAFDLSQADLTGVDLREADLSGAVLIGANLTGARLSRSDLTGADLLGADLSNADLKGAVLFGASLFHARLAQTNLARAELIHADLAEANLSHADLAEANLSGAKLVGVNLTDADLTDATLTAANLSGANLTGANLTDAGGHGAKLFDATLTQARLNGATLTQARLNGANLTGTWLINADLTGADLTGANLTAANLSGANLTDANLTDVAVSETVDGRGTIWPKEFTP